MADIADISTERIQNILQEILGMRKLSTMVAAFNHSGAKTESHDNFGSVLGHVKEFLRRFVTVDETWK